MMERTERKVLAPRRLGETVFRVRDAFPGRAFGGLHAETKMGGAISEDFSGSRQQSEEEGKRRYTYVAEIVKRKDSRMTPKVLRPVIHYVSQATGDATPPSWTTLCRWYRHFKSSGGDMRSLVPNSGGKGSRKGRLQPEVAQLIEYVFARTYVCFRDTRVKTIHAFVIKRIEAMNRLRADGDKLRVPSYSTVRREVRKFTMRRNLPVHQRKRVACPSSEIATKGGARPLSLVKDEVGRQRLDIAVSPPGDTAAGTRSRTRIDRERFSQRATEERIVAPILITTIPASANVTDFVSSLLGSLGDPDHDKASTVFQVRRLRRVMSDVGAKMIVIDEFSRIGIPPGEKRGKGGDHDRRIDREGLRLGRLMAEGTDTDGVRNRMVRWSR